MSAPSDRKESPTRPRWRTVELNGRTVQYAVGRVKGRRVVLIKKGN